MKQLSYFAMTQLQFEQLSKQLELFQEDPVKQKKLYQIEYSVFDLEIFERLSDPKKFCIHRNVLDDLIDPWQASQAIKRAFGQRKIEFVP